MGREWKQEPGSHRCGPAVWPPYSWAEASWSDMTVLLKRWPREGNFACPQLALLLTESVQEAAARDS